ncbi:hypothetical protein AK812_SmicGene49121 [Symbiodinium microadriaticum]|uniref:Protein kinase domain-containing protein n=1 Tax=Symbiodinium microadriaticum TaxID=2951 RepID=A0A1Q9E515_SYMMI|nr:hypothetical protein AK812_SmicGene49121 [Symbiodinium microadriaticum]
MAFVKATRFSGRGSRQSPFLGACILQGARGLSRVLACSFARPKAPSVISRLHKDKASPPAVEIAKLSLARELGHGRLASVAYGTLEGRPVAAKLYRAQPQFYSNKDDDIKALRTDTVRLERIRHPNIVEICCLVSEKGGSQHGFLLVPVLEFEPAEPPGHDCKRRQVWSVLRKQ